MLNIKVVSWSLGLFAAINFVLCVVYGLIMPPSLHTWHFGLEETDDGLGALYFNTILIATMDERDFIIRG